MRKAIFVATVALVASMLISSAGAGVERAGANARFDLSSRVTLNSFLRSVGIDPATVVVQRGARNYAGSRCPGKGWTCTNARRVVQISSSTLSRNKFECTGTSTPADSCVIVQNSEGGTNAAVCHLEKKSNSLASKTQACTITQTNTTGANNAVAEQELELNANQTSATQTAGITQTNASGANNAKIVQLLVEDASDGHTTVAQGQNSNQTYDIDQTAASGSNTGNAQQTVTQVVKAPAAVTGTQSQTANQSGDLDQLSSGLSTMTSSQVETQTARSKNGGNVDVTQIGPQDCCSMQATNPDNTFTIEQRATQLGDNNPVETQEIDYVSSGDGTATQTSTQNGTTETNTDSGSTVHISQTCTGTDCTQTTTPPPPSAASAVYVSVGAGKVKQFTASGTFVKTLDTTQSGFTTGLEFGPDGNLYVTLFSANDVAKFDASGNLIGSFGSGYNSAPESVTFDASGNVYVGLAGGTRDVLKFSPSGLLLATYDVATENVGADHIWLVGCTLYYTSEGTKVKRFDVCVPAQLSDFATVSEASLFGLRSLPDGGLLVAAAGQIVRLSATGTVVQTYDIEGTDFWFTLDLDPNGTSFWAQDVGGDTVKFTIATGAVETSFDSGSTQSYGITVR